MSDISENEYRISIVLDVTNEEDELEPPRILLRVKYPESYPDEPPILDVSGPPNAPTYPYFDVSSDKEQLLSSLSSTIEENIGMVMVFTLVSTLKDLAEQLIAERQAAERAEHERKILEAEMEENSKFHGTLVTPETFKEWRLRFRKEMEELKNKEDEVEEAAEKRRNRGREVAGKLTGRQLWERGMIGKGDEGEEDEGYLDDVVDLPIAQVDKLRV
jgi:RWD domain